MCRFVGADDAGINAEGELVGDVGAQGVALVGLDDTQETRFDEAAVAGADALLPVNEVVKRLPGERAFGGQVVMHAREPVR